jgi:hypothetical protein
MASPLVDVDASVRAAVRRLPKLTDSQAVRIAALLSLALARTREVQREVSDDQP